MATAFRVLLRMRIRAESGADFEQAWHEGADRIATHPDNLGQSLARDSTDPDVYYVTSDWTDEPTFRVYEKSEQHAAHLTRLRPFRLEGSMSTMVLVADKARAKVRT